ncbi:MAG: hypothetical protein ACTSUS_07635 [Candidatus Freyarchaeota archaeon]
MLDLLDGATITAENSMLYCRVQVGHGSKAVIKSSTVSYVC